MWSGRVVRLALALAGVLAAPAGSGAAVACACVGEVVEHGPRGSGRVALTFDACPTSRRPGFSPEIADQLERERVPATFFVSGRWAEAHPKELRRLASVPWFEIGLHGHRHRHLHAGGAEAVVDEIEAGRQALVRLGETPQALFRPPYGDRPRELGEAARRAGVTAVLWDVAPGDPNPHATAADIERAVLRGVQGGSIVVMHVNGRGVATAAALPAVVEGIRRRGLEFVKVSELLGDCGC